VRPASGAFEVITLGDPCTCDWTQPEAARFEVIPLANPSTCDSTQPESTRVEVIPLAIRAFRVRLPEMVTPATADRTGRTPMGGCTHGVPHQDGEVAR